MLRSILHSGSGHLPERYGWVFRAPGYFVFTPRKILQKCGQVSYIVNCLFFSELKDVRVLGI